MAFGLMQALAPKNTNVNFNYEPAMANAGLNYGNIAKQMLSGEGQFFDDQRRAGAGQIQDAAYNAMNQQNMQLAMRGMGGGGLRGLLDATSAAQVGEQTSQFNLGLASQGFQQAGQFGNMALQQAMANQQARNDQMQYTRTATYNQAEANKQRKANFFGNVMKVAGAVATGGTSTMLGTALGMNQEGKD